MTPRLPTWVSIVSKSSNNDTNDATLPQFIVSTSYQRSVHSSNLLGPIHAMQQKSNNSDLDNTEDIQNEHENLNKANSIPTSTPKRRKRKRKSSKSHLISSINHPQYKYLLIAGYIRCKYGINNFPKDLIALLLKFYDEITYWTISGEQIEKFKSVNNGQAMYGPKFKINNILFETTMCSNGWKPNQYGSVQFYIELKSLPIYISSITVYYELSCKQTESHCKKIRIFRKATDAQSWGTNNMRLTECDGHNILQFASLVKILHIEYKKQYKLNECKLRKIECHNVKIKEWTKYIWNIDDKLLNKFIHCQQGKFFYSENFGNGAFVFELAPNGWHETNKGKLMLYLRLLSLPKKIKKIQCVCNFGNKNECDLIPSYNQTHTFCYDVHGLQWPLDALPLDSVRSLNNLSFTVQIRIVQVIDIDGNQIGHQSWPKYDILTNYKPI